LLTAVVTRTSSGVTVRLQAAPPTTTDEEHTTTAEGSAGEGEHHGVVLKDDGYVAEDGTAHVAVDEAAPGPNPIVPEMKEVAWGAGAFIVFAVVMRYVAFPRLKRGMDARYASIRSGHEQADALRLAARREVAEYQQQLAAVKAEAAARIDAVRQEIEAERTSRLAEVNAAIAQQRAAAAAEAEAARVAVQDQIQAAVADVSSSAIRIAVGKAPDAELVNRVVGDVMSAGATR
jgi:F-type H+-transporting ATPase subunit b